MANYDNDTQNANQQNVSQPKADKSKTKEALVAKVLAGAAAGMAVGAAAGMAVGAGAAYAAEHILTDEPVEPAEEESKPQEGQQPAEPAKPTTEERLSELEEKERIREQQEQVRQQHEADRQRHEQQRIKNEHERQNPKKDDGDDPTPPKHDDDFFKDHDVKITAVEEQTLDDGSKVHVYTGTVDGHQAAFMDDGNGHVVLAAVDTNDNGKPEESEMVDLRSQNMTAQQLAQHTVSTPEPEPVPASDHEVHVVDVEHNVDMDGQTVDVAVVNIDNQSAILVDANQNGEVDLIAMDQNSNGQIDNGEIQDVSSQHITMPTQDDVTGNMTADNNDGDINDYSNDADVAVYDV